ncbi:hypothetical protein LINPERPRIM_LOCUS11059, partial [Linum perenne]
SPNDVAGAPSLCRRRSVFATVDLFVVRRSRTIAKAVPIRTRRRPEPSRMKGVTPPSPPSPRCLPPPRRRRLSSQPPPLLHLKDRTCRLMMKHDD